MVFWINWKFSSGCRRILPNLVVILAAYPGLGDTTVKVAGEEGAIDCMVDLGRAERLTSESTSYVNMSTAISNGASYMKTHNVSTIEEMRALSMERWSCW
jgi:hypothetical protein